MPLIRHLLQKGVRVVVPIIERETRTLRLSCLEDPGDLVISTFSVPEPIGNEIPVCGEDLEVIIVPLLAFDRAGHRLGYGAGYYDRFLSSYPRATKDRCCIFLPGDWVCPRRRQRCGNGPDRHRTGNYPVSLNYFFPSTKLH